MTDAFGNWFDRYTFTARVIPAALTAGPILILAVLALPALPGFHKLWGLLSLGITTYAALAARKAGHRVQAGLWESWGGPPTAKRLSYHSGAGRAEINRRHRDVETALGGAYRLPSPEDEDSDPAAALSEYQQAMRRLINRIRHDPAFSLVHVENRHYGFARNLYGLRPLGQRCAFVAAAVSLGLGLATSLSRSWLAAIPFAMSAVASVTALVLWRPVDPEYVRPSADAYADRVLDAAQSLAERVVPPPHH